MGEPPESGNSVDPNGISHDGTTAQNTHTVKTENVSIDMSSFFEVDEHWDIIMDQPSKILEAEN